MPKRHITGWKATIAVSMSNYIDSGSIIAIATSLGFWKAAYFPNDDGTITGLLAAFSSNAFGAAIGALIGGRCATSTAASSSTPTTCSSTHWAASSSRSPRTSACSSSAS